MRPIGSWRRRRWLRWIVPLVIVVAAPSFIAGLFLPFAADAPWKALGLEHSAIARGVSSILDRIRDAGGGSWQPWRHSRSPGGRRGLSAVRGRARVVDGDSLRIAGVNVRLHGIDAPELHQTCKDERGRNYACGREAKSHLQRLVAGRTVSCRRVTTDRYGRMVALCMVDGEDIGRRMVRDGWAIAFVRYSRHYVGDERVARRARRGLWRGRFIPPSLWRRMHRRYRHR